MPEQQTAARKWQAGAVIAEGLIHLGWMERPGRRGSQWRSFTPPAPGLGEEMRMHVSKGAGLMRMGRVAGEGVDITRSSMRRKALAHGRKRLGLPGNGKQI